MKMKCEIIRDLFPSYIDGLTSRESNELIEEHLEDQPFRKISEACGISVGKSFISSEPVLCPAEAGKLLGIPAGAPVLKFCIEIYDTRENPTACEILYTRGKRTKVQLT